MILESLGHISDLLWYLETKVDTVICFSSRPVTLETDAEMETCGQEVCWECSQDQRLGGVREAGRRQRLNWDAVETEPSANLTETSEPGIAHQKCCSMRHGARSFYFSTNQSLRFSCPQRLHVTLNTETPFRCWAVPREGLSCGPSAANIPAGEDWAPATREGG